MKKRFLFFFACLLFLCSCSGIDRKFPEMDQSAPQIIDDPSLVSQIFDSLEQTNAGLQSYKGLGRVRMSNPHAMQSVRVAFAGRQGRQLRFEILGVTGQPLTTLAYDGTWVYLAQHSESRFYRKRSATGDLHQLITIPLKINEINALLSGRVPLIQPDSVQLRKDIHGNGFILVLKSGWPQSMKEIIHLGEDMKTIQKFEMLDSDDQLIYQAEIKAFKIYDGYRIPYQIEFRDKDRNQLLLEVQRYWPNANVDSSLFILQKPG